MPAQIRQRRTALLHLSHQLAREDWRLAILAEGNTSARFGRDSFLIKASGSSLRDMAERDIVECRLSALLPLFERRELSDAEMEKALLDSRKDSQAKKPSVEALFHAYFLTLPGIEFVGHTHPQSVTAILCSPRARDFANRRIFPDEIVCCDTASVFVPYTDPGLPLARAIRKATDRFRRKQGRPPRVVLLENHGLIALGRTVEAVLATTLMAEKAATIWFGAAALGGPKSLKPRHVQRIAARPDEKIRQRELKL